MFPITLPHVKHRTGMIIALDRSPRAPSFAARAPSWASSADRRELTRGTVRAHFGRDVGVGIRGVASPHVSRVGPRRRARAVHVARRESDVRARDDDDDGARGDDDGRGFARRVARRSSESSRARLRGTIGDGASREVGDGDGDVRSGVRGGARGARTVQTGSGGDAWGDVTATARRNARGRTRVIRRSMSEEGTRRARGVMG